MRNPIDGVQSSIVPFIILLVDRRRYPSPIEIRFPFHPWKNIQSPPMYEPMWRMMQPQRLILSQPQTALRMNQLLPLLNHMKSLRRLELSSGDYIPLSSFLSHHLSKLTHLRLGNGYIVDIPLSSIPTVVSIDFQFDDCLIRSPQPLVFSDSLLYVRLSLGPSVRMYLCLLEHCIHVRSVKLTFHGTVLLSQFNRWLNAWLDIESIDMSIVKLEEDRSWPTDSSSNNILSRGDHLTRFICDFEIAPSSSTLFMQWILSLPRLTTFGAPRKGVSIEPLSELTSRSHFTSLSVSLTNDLDRKRFLELANPSTLRFLNLPNTYRSDDNDEGVISFALFTAFSFTTLTSLSISSDMYYYPGWKEVRQTRSLPSLTALSLTGMLVVNEIINNIPEMFPRLRIVNLGYAVHMDGEQLVRLATLKELEVLNVCRTYVQYGDIVRFLQHVSSSFRMLIVPDSSLHGAVTCPAKTCISDDSEDWDNTFQTTFTQ